MTKPTWKNRFIIAAIICNTGTFLNVKLCNLSRTFLVAIEKTPRARLQKLQFINNPCAAMPHKYGLGLSKTNNVKSREISLRDRAHV